MTGVILESVGALAFKALGPEEARRVADEALLEREIFAVVEGARDEGPFFCTSGVGVVLLPRSVLPPGVAAGATLRTRCVPSVDPRAAFRAVEADIEEDGWRSAGRRRATKNGRR